MDRHLPSTNTAFNKLPIEINKEIAHYLQSDRDIANYSYICKATYSAIDGDSMSFWRSAYREKYALMEGLKNKEIKREYKRRARCMRVGMGLTFVRGHTRVEQIVLGMLRDLIVESFRGEVRTNENGHPQCPNQGRLTMFLMNSQLLLNGRRPPPPKGNEHKTVTQLLAAVRLMCAHFLFELEGAQHNVFAIEESQQAVYSSSKAGPIFLGKNGSEVNMEWTLHCLNFFRYHMMTPEASQLYDSMECLDATQKPSSWRESLKTGAYPLGKYWKGTYAYLEHDDLDRLRSLSASKRPLREEDMIFTDLNVDEGKIQTLELNFAQDKPFSWPQLFEDRLRSLRDTLASTTRAQHSKKAKMDPADEATSKNIQLTGTGEDLEDSFYATGWLNPLPEQCDIPGWQRITFMKHFERDLDYIEADNLWAYEGVVLPGGRIILGRWWYASDPVDFDKDYNGPFILWAVEQDNTIIPDDEFEP